MNPTQLTGLIAFAASTLMCARAASVRGARAWRWLAIASLLFLVEVALGLRHQFHDLVIAEIAPRGWYPSRRPAQALFLLVLFVVFCLLARSAVKLRRVDRKAGLAAMCSLAVLCLFLAEAISLHGIDAVLYRLIGPVMVIGWLWAFLAGITAVAAGRVKAGPRTFRGARRANGA